MHQHVLLPVEDTAGTRLALDEVRKWPEGMRPPKLTLLHVLGIYPPALLESGGASDPREEEKQEERLAAKRRAWEDEARKASRPVVERAERALADAGYGSDRVDVSWLALIPEDDVAQRIVDVAQDRGCDRIVVGRSPDDDEGRLDEKALEHLEEKATKDLDVLVVA